jgi:hypothetical protein
MWSWAFGAIMETKLGRYVGIHHVSWKEVYSWKQVLQKKKVVLVTKAFTKNLSIH